MMLDKAIDSRTFDRRVIPEKTSEFLGDSTVRDLGADHVRLLSNYCPWIHRAAEMQRCPVRRLALYRAVFSRSELMTYVVPNPLCHNQFGSSSRARVTQAGTIFWAYDLRSKLPCRATSRGRPRGWSSIRRAVIWSAGLLTDSTHVSSLSRNLSTEKADDV